MSYDFDLLALGCGPAGQKAVIQAAKLHRRAAIVERSQVGGMCVAAGTIPSKTLREAVVYLTGLSQRALYGQSYRLKDVITVEDLRERSRFVVQREVDVIRDQLRRNDVTVFEGDARFVDAHTIAVRGQDGAERHITSESIIVATGSRPVRPATVAFDDVRIVDSDGLLQLDMIPKSVAVVGAGVIGLEYASTFAAVGAKVTLIDARPQLLPFCDAEIVQALQHSLRDMGVVFRLGETVSSVVPHEQGALISLESGKRLAAEALLYSAGRQGATGSLDLPAAGLEADKRGQIKVDETYRTDVENIYAVGDVIGFPALAATAMEQGRVAALNALGQPTNGLSENIPIGIYTIPEISFVGKTEEQLTEAGIPYEIGVAHYRELARGQILGDSAGLLKLLVAPEERTILGVHVCGTSATEVVHIGQIAMLAGATVDSLVECVFNYPTLAESYRVAALDAQNRLRSLSELSA